MKKRNAILLSAVGVVLVATGVVAIDLANPQPSASVPVPVPVASIANLHQFIGKPTVAVLFATSCKYCAYEAAYEIPQLETWAKSHHVNVALIDASNTIGIGTPGTTIGGGQDGSWTPTTDPRLLKSYIYRWEQKYNLVDDAYYNPGLTLAQQYGVHSFPTIVILNSSGRVVKEMKGVQNATALESMAKSAG